MLEEKASESGDVRPDLREALAASVAVAPEPVAPKPKKMPFKGEKGDGKGMSRIFGTGPDFVPNYGPPPRPRVVPAPISQDVKGGKGTNEAQHQHVVPGGPVSLEKGDGKGKGSNATGNLDVKGGKCEKEEVAGKGRAKGKGKKDGKDSTAKGGWDSGAGLDVKGGKGTNEAQHQHVVPGGPVSLEKGDGKGKGSNTTGNLDVKGGKCEKEEVAGKGRAKGKGKKGGKDSTAKGGWDKGHGKGKAKGKGKKDGNGHGKGADAGHQGFLDVKGGKGDRSNGHSKGNAKGKGKKGSKGHGKGANDAEAKGKGKKGGKDFQAKGNWGKDYGKGSPKGNGKKGGKDFQAKGDWDKGYGKGNPKGNGKKGGKGFPRQGGLGQGLWQGQGQQGPRAEHLHVIWEASQRHVTCA